MSDNAVSKKVIEIVEKETGLKRVDIKLDLDLRNYMNLDSMQFVAIAARVEKEFKVDLPVSVIGVNTLNEFVKFIKEELKKND